MTLLDAREAHALRAEISGLRAEIARLRNQLTHWIILGVMVIQTTVIITGIAVLLRVMT
ncbi:MAG TPA: hypothetical protein VGR45_12740 [Stellaceae bacterium]|nr:hypothetical protein [Stellaceae bacterium]